MPWYVNAQDIGLNTTMSALNYGTEASEPRNRQKRWKILKTITTRVAISAQGSLILAYPNPISDSGAPTTTTEMIAASAFCSMIRKRFTVVKQNINYVDGQGTECAGSKLLDSHVIQRWWTQITHPSYFHLIWKKDRRRWYSNCISKLMLTCATWKYPGQNRSKRNTIYTCTHCTRTFLKTQTATKY